MNRVEWLELEFGLIGTTWFKSGSIKPNIFDASWNSNLQIVESLKHFFPIKIFCSKIDGKLPIPVECPKLIIF